MQKVGHRRDAIATQRRNFGLLVATFLGVQLVILALAIGALSLTNLIRAYSTGEGLYAKAQKQAVLALQRYADTGDSRYYETFVERMQVPVGDAVARVAMAREPQDREAARAGLLQGLNHPDDVPGMITVFRLFKDTSLFAPPIALWAEADGLIEAMLAHGAELHRLVQTGSGNGERRRALLAEIYALDQRITALETEFSQVLGDIARQIKDTAIVVLGGTSLLLWIASLAFGLRLHRRSIAAEERLAEREARLFQAQKMEAVGQLTGGVAHDFNNLLTIITGNLELLRDDSRSDGKATRLIDAALGAAERGARVTSHLLAFSRRQPLAPAPVHIDALVDGMRDLLDQTVPASIEIEYRLAARDWHAMIDPAQFEAALLNLVLNARHALPDGGRIVIASERFVADAADGSSPELAPGEYLRVAVSDTGVGIAPEHVARVFEPFFTTREVGSGSGLGLSMVQGFAAQSGGQVRLASTPGEGTTVELYLPRAAVAEPRVDTVAVPDLAQGHARILLVEDSTSVRDVAARMLGQNGYEVESVGDARAALERLAAGPAPDLVVSDIVLPAGLDGVEFARRARRTRPGLAVLLMSGFPRDALPGGGDAGFRLLKKPFTREQLLQAVAESLAETRSTGPGPR